MWIWKQSKIDIGKDKQMMDAVMEWLIGITRWTLSIGQWYYCISLSSSLAVSSTHCNKYYLGRKNHLTPSLTSSPRNAKLNQLDLVFIIFFTFLLVLYYHSLWFFWWLVVQERRRGGWMALTPPRALISPQEDIKKSNNQENYIKIIFKQRGIESNLVFCSRQGFVHNWWREA